MPHLAFPRRAPLHAAVAASLTTLAATAPAPASGLSLVLETSVDPPALCAGAPTEVALTIHLGNDGEADLEQVLVGLSIEDDATGATESDEADIAGGDDDGDGVLDPGETWTYGWTGVRSAATTITIDVTAMDLDLALPVSATAIETIDARAPADCPADTDGDCAVGASDLLNVIADWGTDGAGGGDITGDGRVDVNDLVAVIMGWGGCG